MRTVWHAWPLLHFLGRQASSLLLFGALAIAGISVMVVGYWWLLDTKPLWQESSPARVVTPEGIELSEYNPGATIVVQRGYCIARRVAHGLIRHSLSNIEHPEKVVPIGGVALPDRSAGCGAIDLTFQLPPNIQPGWWTIRTEIDMELNPLRAITYQPKDVYVHVADRSVVYVYGLPLESGARMTLERLQRRVERLDKVGLLLRQLNDVIDIRLQQQASRIDELAGAVNHLRAEMRVELERVVRAELAERMKARR